MDCVAAIDQGTTSSRVIFYEANSLKPLASHQLEHKQIYPQAGWVEHDPMEIISKVNQCMDQAYEKATQLVQGAITIKGIGITNQRETTVVWDKATGKPIYNAVVWMDNRTGEVVKALEAELGSKDSLRPVCGLPVSTYFSGVKLRWLLENVPEVKAAVEGGTAMFGTIDTWLIYNLTGGPNGGAYVTDVTNASRTMMMDLQTLEWSAKARTALHIPDALALPRITTCAELYGHVASGRLQGAPITGNLGDQHAASLGQRCAPGEAKNTYGTGCFLMLNTGEAAVPSAHGLLTTLAFKLGPSAPTHYALEGAIAIAGAGVSWLKDNLGIIQSSKEVEPLAASVPDTAGVYFVPAFGGLFAPRWRPDARACVVGMTQYTTKAHIARALLEAICFQTQEVIAAMQKDAQGLQLSTLRVDGGASSNNLLMQAQADILGVRVVRPADVETTALGAACAAAIGSGILSADDVFQPSDVASAGDVEFQPVVSEEERTRRMERWMKAVSCSLDWE